MWKITVVLTIVWLLVHPIDARSSELQLSKAESVGMSSERLKRIGVGMRRLIDENKIPGTVTLVSRRGKVVHFEANGLRNISSGDPMELDTIFRLYSQTKSITAAAVMILFEEGHFLLTDPISMYLPEFTDMVVYKGEKDGEIETEPAQPIIIQHLLSHTSGLTYDFFPTPVGKMYLTEGIRGSNAMTPGGKQREFTGLKSWSEALAKMPLITQPGTEFNYSVGMDVLGRLVEVVSGQTYGEFLESRLFGPLAMEDTGFYVPADKLNRFAANHSPHPESGLIVFDDPSNSPYATPPALEMGGSGLVGTVSDYLKFAQMLTNRGQHNGKQILGSKTVKLMMANHLAQNFPDDPLTSLFDMFGWGSGSGIGFGFGGFVVANPALTGLPVSVGTYSWGGAATTHFWVDLEEEIVGVVHSQLDGTSRVVQLMLLLTYQAIIE